MRITARAIWTDSAIYRMKEEVPRGRVVPDRRSASAADASTSRAGVEKRMDYVAVLGAEPESAASRPVTTVLSVIIPTLNERENIEPLLSL